MADDRREDRARVKPLYERVADLEDEIFGTREEGYGDGLKPQLKSVRQGVASLRRQITYWGLVLVAIVVASGTLNGKGGEVLGMILKSLTSAQ